jgi:hypothetical protein
MGVVGSGGWRGRPGATGRPCAGADPSGNFFCLILKEKIFKVIFDFFFGIFGIFYFFYY